MIEPHQRRAGAVLLFSQGFKMEKVNPNILKIADSFSQFVGEQLNIISSYEGRVSVGRTSFGDYYILKNCFVFESGGLFYYHARVYKHTCTNIEIWIPKEEEFLKLVKNDSNLRKQLHLEKVK